MFVYDCNMYLIYILCHCYKMEAEQWSGYVRLLIWLPSSYGFVICPVFLLYARQQKVDECRDIFNSQRICLHLVSTVTWILMRIWSTFLIVPNGSSIK